MAQGLVLVTGASGGRQGQTGRHVSEMLLARGAPVRAFVHTADARSERLSKLGAEILVGDFLDISSAQRAVSGISSIYFAYPPERFARRHGDHGRGRARGPSLPPRQSRDAELLTRRSHPAHAAELFVGAGLRLGWAEIACSCFIVALRSITKLPSSRRSPDAIADPPVARSSPEASG